ncbi:flagellar biosynthesis protein FlhB [Tatumella citrea]|uniref:Flagellar biosynthetic protein FlhB n=1 Tax=Tatumella citrea TaxID=53336 RepID=A0A1Y0L848_TATCI|nr:flagellar biosynthesis protein FlhB [Tatumella citrea]ARU94224.1 flagellar biosynthesis protein FlhB [Tatumella citrea]ARU98264.1 flagellar biosynthesis protein FlhB [Tatumella citrea]
MADQDKDDKTEAPSARRIEKAREEGDIPRSRELTSLLMLLAGLLLLRISAEPVAGAMKTMMRSGLHFGQRMVRDGDPLLLSSRLLWQSCLAVLPVLCGVMLVAAAAPMLLGGISLSSKSLKFNPGRMNPVSGFARLFSGQMVAELTKGLLKVVVSCCTAGSYLFSHWDAFLALLAMPVSEAIPCGLSLVLPCGIWVVLSMIPMVGFDVFWQLYSYQKKLRMSRQDLRDEYKQQEGDPQVKSRIRQQMRAAARRRMMAAVPTADVIVTNPTHFAVALQYQEGKMHAPKVVAKGRDKLAARIREMAGQHHIPMLEAPPLARALYRHTEPGDFIPGALYGAVAEVMAWVWQLRRWSTVGGSRPVAPQNLQVPQQMDMTGEFSQHG